MHGMTSGDNGEMADVFIFLICLFLIVILMLDIKTELSEERFIREGQIWF